MTATVTSPAPLEIEFVPDALGIAFVRDLLDAIEAHATDAAWDPGTVIELPFGMPARLDAGYLRDLAEAVDQAGVLGGPEPEGVFPRPAFPFRRSRLAKGQ